MSARRLLITIALALVPAACASEAIPPLPEDLRGMTEQEASCVACHSRGSAPPLTPDQTRTPSAHPSFDPDVIRSMLDG